MRLSIVQLIVVLLSAGCERGAPPVPAPPTTAGATQPALGVRILMPLRPNVDTAVATDPGGSVFWVQRADNPADEVVSVLGADGVPHLTALSARSILLALGTPAGTGHIQSLAWADEHLYAYFNGGHDANVLAAIVRFEPAGGRLRVVADTRRLMDATGMRADLELARAQLIAARDDLWLYIHHSDAFALLRFSTSEPADDGMLILGRAFQSLPPQLSLTRDDTQISAGDGRSLLALDRADAGLWRIDPDAAPQRIVSLVGLPRTLSAPLMTTKHGIVLYAPPGEPLTAPTVDRVVEPVVRTEYPALILIADGRVRALGPTRIHAQGALDPAALRPGQLLRRGAMDDWVGYDRAGGALLVFSLSQ